MLSGCGVRSDYIEPEDRLIVTAIGIDEIGGEIMLTVETADVVSNTNEDIYNAKVQYAKGGNFKTALNRIAYESYGKLIFSQCPVALIGKTTSQKSIEEFLDFCVEEYEISFSLSLAACDNAYDILNSNESKDKLIGYEVFKLLKFGKTSTGITGGDSLARILNLNGEKVSYKIPRLSLTDSDIKISGCTLYEDNERLYDLGLEDTQLIFAVNGELGNCVFNIGGENLEIVKTCFSDNELTVYYKNINEIKDTQIAKIAVSSGLQRVSEYVNIKDFLPESADLKNLKIKIIGEY